MDRFIVEKMVERSKLAEKIENRELATLGLSYIQNCLEQEQDLPNVIFLDINMPEMSGFDFLDKFSNFPDHVKNDCSVVMLSSSLNEEDHKKAMSYPSVKMYCSKPISLAKLEELNNILIQEQEMSAATEEQYDEFDFEEEDDDESDEGGDEDIETDDASEESKNADE